jgi:hypothetical protein
MKFWDAGSLQNLTKPALLYLVLEGDRTLFLIQTYCSSKITSYKLKNEDTLTIRLLHVRLAVRCNHAKKGNKRLVKAFKIIL